MSEALLELIGAAIGGAAGSVAAVKLWTRQIAREEAERTVTRMVRPEARHHTGDFPAVER